MHAQLRDAGVHCPAAQPGAHHRANRAATSTVVPNLESLESASTLVRNTLQEGGADTVGGHMAIRIVLDLLALSMCTMERRTYSYRKADIESRSMIFEVYSQKVGIDSMTDIGRDEEGVC